MCPGEAKWCPTGRSDFGSELWNVDVPRLNLSPTRVPVHMICIQDAQGLKIAVVPVSSRRSRKFCEMIYMISCLVGWYLKVKTRGMEECSAAQGRGGGGG